ncbi:Crp/Fnr family transcriptional regulator [Cylindrospermopsis raciborskii]|uniref:Crp/Fnr family transcriptional regulator n=1 Tax=Cylindrospermopsis raciborskii CENA302 TaxID=1170768 RepID=A0A9Q5QXW8_9CYAN|nr:Crp/Fnr family transcriptional regulator [Cylindrospermopsis raciborskii]MCZ2201092.1 Crp/Fnr family transcriptional regulator [Cylindrospermopsis raciborskii PAMP2012]MCZ2204791.1 Crp/Fnr family transcriptional regulator [Cylindrospermopsis raciborskii PAMP2011]NLQ05474.1 Crp/Fnr family transcriptional regulator [Cylindrospermopsis raciborskii MVCC19]OHY31483.1 Crp/Fnr family transcriptional regulator [Cylindrospermopsis raciborskii MVCC14]OPH10428.1 Crp/Fnr family transcriptional regulato
MPSYTDLSQLSANDYQRSFTRRSLLPLDNSHLWQINSGFVMTNTYLEDGTMIALGLWGRGDIVGQSLTKIKPYQAQCLTNVEASLVFAQDWNQSKTDWLKHIEQAEELMVIRSNKKVETMLIQLLVWLSKKFGSQVEQGRLIDMRLTHEDLAGLISSSRVTVTRLLGQLEQEKVIERKSLNRIIVHQEDIWYYEI